MICMKSLGANLRVVALAFFALNLGNLQPVNGHVFTITEARTVFTASGDYKIDITMDVDALALGVPSSSESAEVARQLRAMSPQELGAAIERAKQTIQRRVRLRFDGRDATPQITFPEYQPGAAENPDVPSLLGVIARLTGTVPADAKEFVLWGSRTFNLVQLTIYDERTNGSATHMLGPAEESPPFPLQSRPEAQSRLAVAWRYLVLGYEHILPKGLDHILFVLGLFLLSTRARPLLLQITAFTIAHSVTLAMSMYGVISLPSRVVETLIALSISYVAFENTLTSELKPWRPAVVFCFGLLHGMGFASVLRELGLEKNQFVTALIAFNVGVECGQLTVVLLAFALVGWFRTKSWYRRRIVIPASILIGVIGLYWAVTRALGMSE